MTDFLLTLISAVLINNFVLQRPLGIDPLLQAARDPALERRRLHALGMATTCLMLTASLINHLVYHYLLRPMDWTALHLFVFLPVSLLLARPILTALQRYLPDLRVAGFWPLLVGNAGVLGLALLDAQSDRGLSYAAALSLGAGLGFWLVLSLFSDLRERITSLDVPLPFRGLPIELISIGLMAVAFLGLNGLIKT